MYIDFISLVMKRYQPVDPSTTQTPPLSKLPKDRVVLAVVGWCLLLNNSLLRER